MLWHTADVDYSAQGLLFLVFKVGFGTGIPDPSVRGDGRINGVVGYGGLVCLASVVWTLSKEAMVTACVPGDFFDRD